jgi:polo-like kinase 4
MVKAKTPKITYYSPLAKCQLMETRNDFELIFYQDNVKVVKSPAGVRATDKFGQGVEQPVLEASDAWRPQWEHYQQCLAHCGQLERTLDAIEGVGSCFPLIVGRKPVAASCKPVLRAQENNYGLLTPKTPSNVSHQAF